MTDPTDPDRNRSEEWRQILYGTTPYLQTLRRVWRHLPSPPRCKICLAPFHGIGGLATRLVMHGQSTQNPMMCNLCVGSLAKNPGGAEVEITVLFADLRGSTGLAEQTDPTSFGALLGHFYRIAATAIEDEDGLVDKFLGDGVMALFIPGLSGQDHAARAVAAGRTLLHLAADSGRFSDVPVGIGIHSGLAFVGVLGSGGRLDFTALGDTVNVASRLASLAGPGELLASAASWSLARLEPRPTDHHVLAIAGREHPIEAVRLTADG